MSQKEKKVDDQDENVEFDMEKYMEARLKPGARIRLPVPKDAKNLVARVEALEVSPAIKKEILEKHYNIYAQNRTIEISPMDNKDDLFGIFLEHITPAINKHNAGHLTDSEFAKYLSNEYARLIHFSCKKAVRFCEDPGLLGSTYFNAEEVAAGRKFNTTWRGFADLDKYMLMLLLSLLIFSYFLSQTLTPLIYFSQLQGIGKLVQCLLENLARMSKQTSLEFTLLSERMSHLEKLVIFLDNQNHVLADQNKAMMGSLMKSQVESNAAISRVADVVINVLKNIVDINGKEVFSKEELLQRMFGPSEDSLSASHFKDLTKAMPSDDEVMQEVVFRLNELSVKDVSQPQNPVMTAADIPHAPMKPLGKNFKANVKELEKFRSPASVSGWGEGEPIAICKDRVKNRTPAVNYPVELLKITSKNEAIERVKSLCQDNLQEQPKRRKGNFRPEKRSDKLVEARKAVEDYECGDKNPRRQTRSSRSLRSSSESSNPSRGGFSSPKRKLDDEPPSESPKRAKKSKQPTARKSTTPKDKGKGKSSKPETPEAEAEAPGPSLNDPEHDEPQDQDQNQDINLDETIIEISSDEESNGVEEARCVGRVTDDFDDEPVDPIDQAAREIKRELIDETESKESSKTNVPSSPINED